MPQSPPPPQSPLPSPTAINDAHEKALKQWYWQNLHQLMWHTSPCTPATGQLLGALVAVFLLTTFPAFNEPTNFWLEWGILYTPWILQGEVWRIISGQLMHASWGHIASNCFGLLLFGRQVEALTGYKKMWLLFSVCMGVTAAFTMAFSNNGSIGASGISYGVLGCNIVLVFLIRQQLDNKQTLKDGVGLSLLAMAYIWMNLTTENLNIWGHLGGFTGGCLFAVWRFKQLKQAQ